ncbi:MAG: hypothetical protein ACKVPX_15270 [Myxococcaceae bacterium]
MSTLGVLFSVVVLAAGSPDAGSDGGASDEVAFRKTSNLSLQVGETLSLGVGSARGLLCDDLSVVSPNIQAEGGQNVVRLLGLRIGKTLCRAGSDAAGGPQTFFDITVRAADDGGSPNGSD